MYKKILGLLLCVALLMAGCGGKSVEKDNNPFSIETMKLGYDGQPYISVYDKLMAETEEGYYYFDTSNRVNLTSSTKWIANYLMFFDKNSKISVPVCNNPDCEHELGNQECNAQFGSIMTEEKYSMVEARNGLFYCDGNLYVMVIDCITNDNTNEYNLYQISPDGSIRRKYIELFSIAGNNNGVSGVGEMFYHRGYLYYSIVDEKEAESIYRVKIEKDAKPKLLVEAESEANYISEYQIYNTGITYSEVCYSEDYYSESIKYVDCNTGKTEVIMEDTSISMYTIVGDTMYYTKGAEVYAYSIKDKISESIFSAEYDMFISYDGKYLYVEEDPFNDNGSHCIHVLDLEGNEIDNINITSEYNCYFGNSDYLFQMFNLEADGVTKMARGEIRAFDKKQIGTGNCEWISLPLPE